MNSPFSLFASPFTALSLSLHTKWVNDRKARKWEGRGWRKLGEKGWNKLWKQLLAVIFLKVCYQNWLLLCMNYINFSRGILVKYYECSNSGKGCSGILFISESKFAVPIALTGYDCASGEYTQNSLGFSFHTKVGCVSRHLLRKHWLRKWFVCNILKKWYFDVYKLLFSAFILIWGRPVS